MPGTPPLYPGGPWTLLREDEAVRQYHAGTIPLELFRSDTLGYKDNLLQQPPRIFVVLRQNADPAVEHEVIPYLVTADASAGENYGQAGDEIVDAVRKPPVGRALVRGIGQVHHVEGVLRWGV